MINEVVVVSGKGGTGKTTLVASMLAYLKQVVVADCDVDAPDLHLLLKGEEIYRSGFSGLKRPVIDNEKCTQCGVCVDKCNFAAISKEVSLIKEKCEGCGVCQYVCPQNSIMMVPCVVGEIVHRQTAKGEFVFGRLIPGEETSGKLVSAVRKKAKKLAEQKSLETVIIDGAPGIACNVIASVTGANHVVIVTEPTISGLHDLQRVYELVQRFRVAMTVVVNKADLSEKGLNGIRDYCNEQGISIGLEIPFHKGIVDAIGRLHLPPESESDFFESLNFRKFLKDMALL